MSEILHAYLVTAQNICVRLRVGYVLYLTAQCGSGGVISEFPIAEIHFDCVGEVRGCEGDSVGQVVANIQF